MANSGDKFGLFRLAAVQASSVFLNRDATVDKACHLIDEAGAQGAQIIGFPEGFIPGHPLWYGHYLADCPESRELECSLFANAVDVPGPATDKIGQAARRAGAYVVIGVCERVPGTLGTLYNSQLFFGPDGSLLGTHRKLVPTGTERLVHARGDGSSLRTYETPAGPIGGLICGENTNSFPRLALLLQGERIHVASWPPFILTENSGNSGIDLRVRYHAFEGKTFVISAAGVADDDMLVKMGIDPQAFGVEASRGGHSGIVGPQGEYIAGPADDRTEMILYADADLNQIVKRKVQMDVTGHYNRLDIFSLVVRPNRVEPFRCEMPWQTEQELELGEKDREK
ncbi:Nitrilase [Castellaniella defragrans]